MPEINLKKLTKRSTQKLIYETYYGQMLGVCMRYSSDRSEAEDLLHDGFIKAFNNIHKFSGKGSLPGWIRRVIVNNAIDTIRLKNRESANLNDYMNDSIEPIKHDIEITADKFSSNQLMDAIQKLPVKQRAIFNLFAMEDYSHPQIAEKLNIHVGTSKSSYFKAKNNLVKYLKEIEN